MGDSTAHAGVLPLLPLRAMALFPGTTLPVDLGRPLSLEAVRAAGDRDRDDPTYNKMIVATQRDAMVEQPGLSDLHGIAVVARIVQVLHGLPGRMTVLVRGLHRVELRGLERLGKHGIVSFGPPEGERGHPNLCAALAGALVEFVRQHEALLPVKRRSPQREQTLEAIARERDPGLIADMSAAHIDLETEERVRLLQEVDLEARLRSLMEHASRSIQELEVKRDIDRSVRDHLSRNEQEAVLRHKMRAIQTELGESDGGDDWNSEIRRRLADKDLSEAAEAAAARELGRIARMNPQSSESMIARTYVGWLADLPWGEGDATHDDLDIAGARQQLDEDHHGLDRVKKRVIEYLSVRKLAPTKKGPILCLAGPPGVGKTSLARSIATALGRKFVRISLGGVRDDAEIRGHRRTYVGAQPGRLIYSLKKAGSSNPVFLLDEVDKLSGPELRGDPSAALLEALDPEQNDSFEDHYLAVPYDLSQVIFICTANELSAIPGVLRDRMEVILLSGYTIDEEKLAIARQYLLPREMSENGLRPGRVDITDDAIRCLASLYTRESGVRNLQRTLASVLRDVAMQIAEGGEVRGRIEVDDLVRVLGPPRYHEELMGRSPAPGVVTGLGWTPTGGRLLFVEATTTPGKGKLRMTGSLGDVMKESGQAALSLVRSNTERFKLPADFMEHRDIHIHLPSGGVPKDGPSAGIAVTTALVSALSERPARHDIAMTGEVTLRGHVLPVGGIREKVLAAHRAGIRDIILPKRNKKDEPDIPEQARDEMSMHYVGEIDEVLELVLC